jgi:hypothetical protein
MDTPHSIPFHQHHSSTSFVDSAIDIGLTGTSNSSKPLSAHTVPLSGRLTRLAHLAADQLAPRNHLSEHDHSVLSHHLDAIESFLDPRPELSREIARNRPQSPSSDTISSVRASSKEGKWLGTQISTPESQSVNRQLAVLLNALSHVTAQLRQRRIESRHIHDLYTLKCESMAQKIIQLEDQVHDL